MRGYQSRRRLFVEPLESRRLLAAAKADLGADGVLNLAGTGKSDRIQVSVADTALTVTFNKQSFQFNTADVTGIHIDGGGGNDWIWVDDDVLVSALIDGGAGNDRIHGGGGDDTIAGGKGNDRLSGGGGIDTINGDAGNDWAWGDDGDDVVHGDAGNDHVFGGAGLDQVFGDAGQDSVNGDDGDDVVHGGSGHDRLHGGAGNDQLFGEAGKDSIWGDDGDDKLLGGGDNDHLWGGAGNDALKGEAGSDHLDGGAGDNLLDGDTGKDHCKNGFVVDLDQELIAQLTSASGATAKAHFEQEVEDGLVQTQLVIQVEHAHPGDVLDVTIDGQLVGQITVDADGNGSLRFSSNPDSTTTLPFPSGLSLHEGSTISIGSDLSGTFVAEFE